MSTHHANTVKDLPGDAEVESRTRAIFAAACQNVDARHAAALRHARRAALAVRRDRPPLRTWAPLAGAAACCALAIGIAWRYPAFQRARVNASVPVQTQAAAVADSDATPDVGSSQMELVQNLDFYRWLATQPTLTAAPSGSSQ